MDSKRDARKSSTSPNITEAANKISKNVSPHKILQKYDFSTKAFRLLISEKNI